MQVQTEKKIMTKANEIWLDENGILWVKALDSGEFDLEEVKACFDAYRTLGCDKQKVLQVIDVRNSNTMTKEARDYAGKHAHEFFIASAVVSDSLAVRIIVNFVVVFYKNMVPLKMFSTPESALKWLNKFKK